jgi:hypothetical protein
MRIDEARGIARSMGIVSLDEARARVARDFDRAGLLTEDFFVATDGADTTFKLWGDATLVDVVLLSTIDVAAAKEATKRFIHLQEVIMERRIAARARKGPQA